MRKWLRSGVLMLAALAAAGMAGGSGWLGISAAAARESAASDGSRALDAIVAAGLPGAAQRTLRLIRQGGPFPYAKDGTVFGNRERLLPARPRGYYREYTVATPARYGRGARRIICGGKLQSIGDCYYTDDHYSSFKRIVG